jgi:osmoprotectant transport system ATP-binding protein
MIELRGVGKTYRTACPAVESPISPSPPARSSLVGHGMRKTTTLKMINRLIEPSAGTIRIAGRDAATLPAAELRRGIGYVIQQVGLFPHRTVADNIATVPRLLGWDRAAVEARITALVDLMGLDPEVAGRYPADLGCASGLGRLRLPPTRQCS